MPCIFYYKGKSKNSVLFAVSVYGELWRKSAAWDRGIGILYGSCRMRRWANAVMCRRSGFSPVHLGIRERMSLKNFVLRVWCVDKFTKFAT